MSVSVEKKKHLNAANKSVYKNKLNRLQRLSACDYVGIVFMSSLLNFFPGMLSAETFDVETKVISCT